MPCKMSLPGRVRGMAGTMAKWLPKPDSVAARLLHCKVVTPIGKGFSLGCVPEEAVKLSMGSPKNPSEKRKANCYVPFKQKVKQQ